MQGWGRRSLKPGGKHTVEKKVNVVSAAEKAFQRCARRDYRISLEKDVSNLQKKLKEEVDTHKALERAFRRTLGVLPRFSPGLPSKVRELLAEVAVLEEEVISLEECIVAVRQELYNEAVYLSSSKVHTESGLNSELLTKEDILSPKRVPQIQHLQNGAKSRRNSVIAKLLPPVIENKKEACVMKVQTGIEQNPSRVAVSCLEKPSCKKTPLFVTKQSRSNQVDAREEVGTPRSMMSYRGRNVKYQEKGLEKENQLRTPDKVDNVRLLKSDTTGDNTQNSLEMSPKVVSSRFTHLKDGETVEPNLLSEEMVWCLSSVFLRLTKQGSFLDCETSSTVSRSSLSSVWSFTSRNSVGYNPSSNVTEEIEVMDPYKICGNSTFKDIGPYQYYQEVTTSSLDYSKIPRSAIFLKKLMILVEKLRKVDLRGLTHQQKLSFWINIYNACIMHGFLEHGIPNNPNQVVALMGKAVINVGGHSLSALAIEHFILRLPCESVKDSWKSRDREKEGWMRSTYGLEWPEPLVSFALCCGSWSSPALRIYTPQGVEHELEIAKAEYLQATIGVTPTRICIPKMLDWYMRDFAKDAESLMDWVLEQLPGALGRSVQRCLSNSQGKAIAEVVEVMPYDFSFRYLMAVQTL
eukprot:c20214_g1_i3 orf=438-2342(-)